MSDTPRTDAAWEACGPIMHSREDRVIGFDSEPLKNLCGQFERELAEKNKSFSEETRLRKHYQATANALESWVCLKTHFTGDPPYVGDAGLVLALDELRAYAVSQTQLLDRAIKMMQMAGYGVALHDADHNNPVIAWMAEARELLTKDPAQPALGSLSSPQTGAQPERHETGTKKPDPCLYPDNGRCAYQCQRKANGEAGCDYSELRHQSCTQENVAENAYHDATDLIEEAIKAGADLPRSLLESLDILLRHYALRHQVGRNEADLIRRASDLFERWNSTDIDPDDEEYEPWIADFTASVASWLDDADCLVACNQQEKP